MTTIAARRVRKKIEVSADRQVTTGFSKTDNISKVFQNGPVLFGVAGRVRVANVLQHVLDVPKKTADMDPVRWAYRELIPAIQKVLEDNKALGVEDGWSDNESNALIFAPGVAGVLGSDFSLSARDEEFWAIGSGADFALGAMAVGKSAAVGVEVAGRMDIFTGQEVESWELKC